ncbi:8342_t:CDS:2 [Funneliformis mosseae]|uniref:8342_t:CDS:1 n=1 Tax=Funneliformis mosseae TaxID=27381 RepID=A0A9N9H3Z8_FUNMO|nr:8342_t:CDS:2 [Funneliformis mosseae]
MSGLYPIRVNMKTLVILRNTQFITKGHPESLQQPGYICEAGDSNSTIFDRITQAIEPYVKVFSSLSMK